MSYEDRLHMSQARDREIQRLRSKLEAAERELSNCRIQRDTADIGREALNKQVTELLNFARLSNEEYRQISEEADAWRKLATERKELVIKLQEQIEPAQILPGAFF